MSNMQKSLPERVAERALRKKKKGRGSANRALFLALKSEISATLDQGWSVREVWETLTEEGTVTFSYDSFLSYVKKLIRKSSTTRKPDQVRKEEAPPPAPSSANPRPEQPQTSKHQEATATGESEPARADLPAIGAFSFSPRPKR